ncbi:hypothetical protein OU790_18785, partial [Ruegeria sp. NA]|nr:hypothetical protein [Ruegeria sp. NA]
MNGLHQRASQWNVRLISTQIRLKFNEQDFKGPKGRNPMTQTIDFIYDFCSPNAFLAHKMLPDLA